MNFLSDQQIKEVIKNEFGLTVDKLIPITNSASPRLYCRVFSDENSYIFTYSENIDENETFFYFQEQLHSIQIKVPALLKIAKDRKSYIQQDVGDENALSYIQKNKLQKSDWQQILTDLVSMQVELGNKVDFSQCYDFQIMDKRLIINDLFYFKNYFIEYLEIPYRKERLIDDFNRFSEKIENLPNSFFLYRDFISRNIMVFQDSFYYIDFQGAMKGILSYDLVSFSWQAKAAFSDEQKQEMKNFYDQIVMKHTKVSQEELDASFQLSLVLRLYQLLGAYGFRGLVQQKSHFKESIELALENIQTIVHKGYLEEYPEWQYISKKYLKPNTLKI